MSNNLTPAERIKTNSDGLRGTLKQSLEDHLTGALREDDQTLIKHHGMYQQDDRDLRESRSQKKLEWLYSFMIRLRLPGGFLTPAQWVAMHHIAGEHSTGVIKITTRQTIQLHGILKSHLKPTLKSFATQRLDSIAACGDVNRNVICSAHPKESPVHEEVFKYADKISAMGMPKSNGYYEIWLDREPLLKKEDEIDPLYQDRYLPRKFKIAIAIPPNNDVDVYTNDVGLIAIIEDNKLLGFNISIGGGLGTTHGNKDTYPRLGTVIGFTDTEEKTLKAIYEIITVQRDFGNRADRKQARLKYTIDKMGIENFKAEVESRCGFKLDEARPHTFTDRTDHFGWHQNHEGKWYFTAFIENGRIVDEKVAIKTALYEIAQTGKANFRFTANQKLIVSDILPEHKSAIEKILVKYGMVVHTLEATPIRRNAIACVALNTCPLALAEGQRYLPTLVGKIEPILKKYHLDQDPISIRMTGCPNGCGRPYVAEIGLIGTSYGHYNLHLGGDRLGMRLNTKYYEQVDEETILNILDPLLEKYSKEKNNHASFGDFIHAYPDLVSPQV
ncbi:MAG: NADPH-dependent assimilatory sulfite reductase hemoprotein subunit [Saprospiraceae bacterium]|nr:NADPH-dependent assimilatory sulfite reductase hemoprotein subunit [Saprospiraceae bacterium]MBK8777226.1 NADPH-dependent assimilatory sulfite reductase hemoprotein subunit [Saprospiraceae bacterium]MBK9930369.1 NADPH-dependent assimilatory sulfite reductase hemoprotein subunit [Saprospiraceae bacterium]MBL0113399.1 NADPH-dependent assimilatory sulfite reductase hemoprotein subunit [Saprospiraceae bacterium]MBP7923308.1 NADPH-dependent assimilatory sulfite reductase hemoprotein subunit [Sapr